MGRLLSLECRPLWPSSGCWLGLRPRCEETERHMQSVVWLMWGPCLVSTVDLYHAGVFSAVLCHAGSLTYWLTTMLVFTVTDDTTMRRHAIYMGFLYMCFIGPLVNSFLDPIGNRDDVVIICARRCLWLAVVAFAQFKMFGQISLFLSCLHLPGLAYYIAKCSGAPRLLDTAALPPDGQNYMWGAQWATAALVVGIWGYRRTFESQAPAEGGLPGGSSIVPNTVGATTHHGADIESQAPDGASHAAARPVAGSVVDADPGLDEDSDCRSQGSLDYIFGSAESLPSHNEWQRRERAEFRAWHMGPSAIAMIQASSRQRQGMLQLYWYQRFLHNRVRLMRMGLPHRKGLLRERRTRLESMWAVLEERDRERDYLGYCTFAWYHARSKIPHARLPAEILSGIGAFLCTPDGEPTAGSSRGSSRANAMVIRELHLEA